MLHNALSKLVSLNSLYIASFFLLLVFFCYGITLGNSLFFDDEQFIYNNPYVQKLDIPGFFIHSLSSESGQISNYYRPLLFLGFGVEYRLFNTNGFIYHFDSFMLHAADAFLLYLLLKKIFKRSALALLTSTLFLVHPIQTEAIAYASGRGDPLSFFFILTSLNLILLDKKRYLIIACLSLIAALLSKEVALMTPGLIYLCILFSKKNFSKYTLIKSLIETLPYAVITIGYFILRITVLNFSNTLNFYNSANVYSRSILVRLSTFFDLFPTYVGLLLYPKNLFMERDSGIHIVTTPTIHGLLSLISLIGIFLLGIYRRKELPIILFSILWIGIAFIPASGIIPINGIFYEHFLYFPSVGIFLLFSFLILAFYRLLSKTGKEILGIMIITGILLVCIRTIYRNSEWHDPITFYSQTLKHVQSPRAYNNLAMAYAENSDNKNAIISYKKAINLIDAYPESHYNLANSYIAVNDILDAEKEYKNALKINPTFYLSYIKLYTLYKSTNNNVGIKFVEAGLTTLGKYNPQYIRLLHDLENQ